MYCSSLSTHRCNRVLHCSKLCYSSWTPGRSVAVPFLPSPLQLMKNGFLSVHLSLWCTEKSQRVLNLWIWRMFKYSNAFIGKKLIEKKGVLSWALSWCSIQTLFFQRFGRFFRKVYLTVSLLIPTMSAIILTFRRRTLRTLSLIFWIFWSVFKVKGWPGLLIVFHLFPTLTKSFVLLKHTWTWH